MPKEPPMAQTATLPPLVRGVWYPMTWEEFLDWCDEGQSEWVDGKGIAYVSNSTLHGRRVAFLAELLRIFVRVFDLGEVFAENQLLRLPTRPSGRMPDVFVLGRDQLHQIQPQWVEGPPLLGAEFISDESVERDLVEKRAEFERAGMREYLPIDARPDHFDFLFLRLDEAGHYQEVAPDAEGRYHSEALPGFWLDPNWFWQDPLPDVEDAMFAIAGQAYDEWLAAKRRTWLRGRGGE
jgi:Uma2 family endonuclease